MIKMRTASYSGNAKRTWCWPGKSRLKVKAINVLANKILQNATILKSNHSHVCFWWDSLIKTCIKFWFYSFGFQSPDTLGTTEIWNARWSAYSSPCMHNQMLGLFHHINQLSYFITQLFSWVKFLDKENREISMNSDTTKQLLLRR